MPDIHCFMVAPRMLRRHASVAATAVRKRHPSWTFWLVAPDGAGAPWRETAHAAFDEIVCGYALASSNPSMAVTGQPAPVRRLGSVFRHLFDAGAQTAVFLNPLHVWFSELPPDLTESDNARVLHSGSFAHDAHHQDAVALLALRRGVDIENAIACAQPLPTDPADEPSAKVIGLRPSQMQQHPLRFDTHGQLRWGRRVVGSIDFSEQAAINDQGLAVDTTWLEVQRWYQRELSRFEYCVPGEVSH